MFRVIVVLVFLVFMYFALKREKKAVRFTIFTYFMLQSIVFLSGIFYISSTYRLYEAPVDGGFKVLNNWVVVFAFLYIVPTFLLFSYSLFKMATITFEQKWIRIGMYTVWFLLLLVASLVFLYMFVLIFYGFAP
ncbi:hypothetical protein J416_12684 [Gracilibacillus halophilus YIM-C55.5]|uniref:Uncharacterized protein n=1 Tax=Gracilibacillus halophilus YIM-C55.5 TaxID=1308866 RepID=N4WNM6_9BACI|nr:hypothetical protein J416_12684 [Gracilibacillus halophilus YIM-C55.5]